MIPQMFQATAPPYRIFQSCVSLWEAIAIQIQPGAYATAISGSHIASIFESSHACALVRRLTMPIINPPVVLFPAEVGHPSMMLPHIRDAAPTYLLPAACLCAQFFRISVIGSSEKKLGTDDRPTVTPALTHSSSSHIHTHVEPLFLYRSSREASTESWPLEGWAKQVSFV